MYNHLKQTVDAFEITLGINKGYGHNNECVTDFEADYQAIATDIYKRTGVYVSAVITQRCSHCGHVKTDDDKIGLDGNKKHGTKHNEYICYSCGFVADRDQNAVLNLLALA